MKTFFKKLVCFLISVTIILGALSSCGNDEGSQLISFSQSQTLSSLKELDGKEVSIIGYMAKSSPPTGQYMYLMNLPYQTCPFCVPNTSNLANTIAVYAKGNDRFDYTDRAIFVTGELEIANITDDYGYSYTYRIKDATYRILDESELSGKTLLWQQLASTDVVADVYKMYDYLYFLCYWPEFTAEFDGGKDYLYQSDIQHFLESQFSYAYGKGDEYFDNLINTIKEVDSSAFDTLVNNIEKAKAFSKEALEYCQVASNYTQVDEYSGLFNDGLHPQFKPLDVTTQQNWTILYHEFSLWIDSWEI